MISISNSFGDATLIAILPMHLMRLLFARVLPFCIAIGIAGTASAQPYLEVDSSSAASTSESSSAGSQPFTDVTSDQPNLDAISYLKTQGVVQGYADGTFRPDATINRAEFVKILVENSQTQKGTSLQNGTYYNDCHFSDVSPGDWFASDVCFAKSQSWVVGYADGTFRPAANINFAEAAKIISTIFQLPVTQTDVWFKGYVIAMADMNDIPTDIRSFDQPITRGEMAEMIYRLQANITDRPSMTFDDLAGQHSSAASAALSSSSDSSIAISDSITITMSASATAPASSLVINPDGSGVQQTDAFGSVPSSTNQLPPGTLDFSMLQQSISALPLPISSSGTCDNSSPLQITVTYQGQTIPDDSCLPSGQAYSAFSSEVLSVLEEAACYVSGQLGNSGVSNALCAQSGHRSSGQMISTASSDSTGDISINQQVWFGLGMRGPDATYIIHNDDSGDVRYKSPSTGQQIAAYHLPAGTLQTQSLRQLLMQIGDVSQISAGTCAAPGGDVANVTITYGNHTSPSLYCAVDPNNSYNNLLQQIGNIENQFPPPPESSSSSQQPPLQF